MAGFSLPGMLTGKKWRLGIFNWIADMSGNLRETESKKTNLIRDSPAEWL